MTGSSNAPEAPRLPRSRSSSATASRARRMPLRNPKDHGYTGQASWISSVINLVNTIVGAGVLAMPLALSHMGVLLGLIVIVWAGITAAFGLYLQTRCARYLERGQSSFFALSQMTYPRASVIFDAAIAVKCFGVGVSYLIIIGDLMPGVVSGFSKTEGEVSFLTDRHFWITAFMLIVIPFSFLRRLDSLKYTSLIALVSIGYLVILVVYHFVKRDTYLDKGPVRVIEWGGLHQFLASLPVMVFAYTCHQNMFSILNEMKDNSPVQATSVVTASIGSACGTYILVAITGYLSFGDNIAGNIVSMYTPSISSTIGRAAIVVLVMFSYPLQVHPCRASVDAVVKWFGSVREDEPSPPRSAPLLGRERSTTRHAKGADSMTETRFATVTTAIIILSYTVAMTVSSLEKVLAYVGSTGSTSISFILPGLFFYKISDPDSPHHQRLLKEDDEEEQEYGSEDDDEATITSRRPVWRRQLTRKLGLALAIYGVGVMIICLVSNTYFNATH